MAENSKIIVGLPNLPPDTIDPKLWGEFLTVYRGIRNLLAGVSQFTGIDGPDALEISTMDPTKYLLGANGNQWYPVASTGITRGQLVRITGANTVGVADATSAAAAAIGVADSNAAGGQNVKVLLSGSLTTAIGGMSPGTLYYLSTTPGAIQNLRPVAAGEIVQPIGWALTSGQLYVDVNSYFEQL